MSDAVRDLIVSLSLDVGEFTRYMRAINASIKEEESSFKLAGAGVSRLESSLGGQMGHHMGKQCDVSQGLYSHTAQKT